MILELPCDPTLLSYDFTTTLDGGTYTLDLHWNERDASWYLAIADANGTTLLAGRKLQLAWPILARFRYLGTLPPGELLLIDTSLEQSPPGPTDLGARCQLVYVDQASLAAGKALQEGQTIAQAAAAYLAAGGTV